jgi:Ras-related protein Rab-7A
VQVSEKKASEWCASMGGIPCFETSAKEDCNIDEAFLCDAKTALEEEHEHEHDMEVYPWTR